MLKAAIEKIQEMAQPIIKEIDGKTFCISKESISEIKPMIDLPQRLTVNSLDSLIQMVKTEGIILEKPPLYVQVPNHEKVVCFCQYDKEIRCIRKNLYDAIATDIPGWSEKVTMKFEEAMIAIRTRFQESQDSLYALKLLSDITTGSKITYNDNGIVTSVVTKTGIAMQSNESIRPIIKLRPYRTFQEVEQPESLFLIRINEHGITFVEADGGMWKLTARNTVKSYLEKALSDEISEGTVVVSL